MDDGEKVGEFFSDPEDEDLLEVARGLGLEVSSSDAEELDGVAVAPAAPPPF